MKILFISQRFHTNHYLITKALKYRGHTIKYLVRYKGGSEEYSEINPNLLEKSWFSYFMLRMLQGRSGVFENYAGVPKYEKIFGFPSIMSLYKNIKIFKPDVVVIKNQSNGCSLISLIISRVLGINIIIDSQKAEYREGNKLNNLLQNFILYLFNAVLITPVKGDYTKGEKYIKRSHYLPFVAEVRDEVEQKMYFEGNRINIISVGKFEERKNHLLLLRAINNIKNEYPLFITIVGELTTTRHNKYYEMLMSYIKKNNMCNYVSIKTNLSYHELQKLFLNNDLFVLPSRDEPAAISHLEAMSNGLPVICSDSNGTKNYIEEGNNGYIFKTDDYINLGEKIKLIISNRSRNIQMGRYSIKLAMQKYSAENYYNNFISIINKYFRI